MQFMTGTRRLCTLPCRSLERCNLIPCPRGELRALEQAAISAPRQEEIMLLSSKVEADCCGVIAGQEVQKCGFEVTIDRVAVGPKEMQLPRCCTLSTPRSKSLRAQQKVHTSRSLSPRPWKSWEEEADEELLPWQSPDGSHSVALDDHADGRLNDAETSIPHASVLSTPLRFLQWHNGGNRRVSRCSRSIRPAKSRRGLRSASRRRRRVFSSDWTFGQAAEAVEHAAGKSCVAGNAVEEALAVGNACVAEAMLMVSPEGGSWDWPLSRFEKKARVVMLDRAELLADRHLLAQEVRQLRRLSQ